jgi:uncharacterized membrane protein
MHRTREFRYKPWLIPGAYTAIAVVLSFVLPRIEDRIFPHLASPLSISAATAIYSAVASGMIALTGIVFSLTFVMVQFSASAYSPRLVLWLARDPLLAHALGVFIATFVYAIAALAWLERGNIARVPLISSWLVVALLLASMGTFIALIERIGALQVNRVLTFTGDQGRRAIATVYPPLQSPDQPTLTEGVLLSRPAQTLIYRGQPRAVQTINLTRLLELATAHDCLIELVASVGDVAIELMPVLHVFGSGQKIDEQALWNAIHFGEQRTFTQDPKYAIRLLVDVAIRALSPAINDPTTATQALDQIGDLLVRLGLRRLEIGTFHDSRGSLRLLVPFPSWEDFILLGFDEIRYYGASSVQVMRRMSALVSDLISVLPEVRRPALIHWQQRIQNTIARSFEDAEERDDASQEDRQGLGTTRRHAAA